MRDNKNDPTPYAIYCRGDSIEGQTPCGLVFLNKEGQHGYLYQMNKRHGWYCPNCESTAIWDDYCQETNPPEEPPGCATTTTK